MFLASDVIKRHFGTHAESQESSSLSIAKHFLCLSLAKIRPKVAIQFPEHPPPPENQLGAKRPK